MFRGVLLISFLIICKFSFAQTIEDCDKMILKAVEEMNNKNHSKSLEILTKVRSIAEDNDWRKQLFFAYNNIGANYSLMLDYGEALDNYLQAYRIALKDLDAKHEMTVLNNIAILYSKEHKFEKAEEYFLKAYDIAKENHDSIKIGMYAMNLATVASEKKDVGKSESYIQIAVPLVKNFSSILAQAQITHVYNLVLEKEFKRAKEIALQLLPTLNTPELSESRLSLLLSISDIYKNEGNVKLAIEYANLVKSDPNSSLEHRVDVYNQLTELYRKLNDNSTAFVYKDSVIITNDSLNQIKNGKLFENSRIKFELQNYQKELYESHDQLKSERKLFYIFLGGILFLILITIWAIRIYGVNLRQRKTIAESKQKIAELELEKETNIRVLLEQQIKEKQVITLFEQETFKNELEAKNRKIASKALAISTRNEMIENIIDALMNSFAISQNELLKQRVFELKNHLKRESKWNDFFTHFEEVNRQLLKSLKENHPKLTSDDLRYLSYISMNLSTKEISSLLNITGDACRKRKERIAKKMNLPQETDLYSYLAAI